MKLTRSRITASIDLLRKNKISYGYGKTGSVRGFNYDSDKEETVAINSDDIVIPSVQPKSALVKVLFEPQACHIRLHYL